MDVTMDAVRRISTNIETVDDRMAAILRSKTGAERLKIANGLFVFARDLIINTLRADHPDWDEPQIRRETARRLSHGAV
jgi:hypothetical protein